MPDLGVLQFMETYWFFYGFLSLVSKGLILLLPRGHPPMIIRNLFPKRLQLLHFTELSWRLWTLEFGTFITLIFTSVFAFFLVCFGELHNFLEVSLSSRLLRGPRVLVLSIFLLHGDHVLEEGRKIAAQSARCNFVLLIHKILSKHPNIVIEIVHVFLNYRISKMTTTSQAWA